MKIASPIQVAKIPEFTWGKYGVGTCPNFVQYYRWDVFEEIDTAIEGPEHSRAVSILTNPYGVFCSLVGKGNAGKYSREHQNDIIDSMVHFHQTFNAKYYDNVTFVIVDMFPDMDLGVMVDLWLPGVKRFIERSYGTYVIPIFNAVGTDAKRLSGEFDIFVRLAECFSHVRLVREDWRPRQEFKVIGTNEHVLTVRYV